MNPLVGKTRSRVKRNSPSFPQLFSLLSNTPNLPKHCLNCTQFLLQLETVKFSRLTRDDKTKNTSENACPDFVNSCLFLYFPRILYTPFTNSTLAIIQRKVSAKKKTKNSSLIGYFAHKYTIRMFNDGILLITFLYFK